MGICKRTDYSRDWSCGRPQYASCRLRFADLDLVSCRPIIDSADVWLTVPAAWDAQGCSMMREAAIAAGLVQSSRAGDHDWRDRLRIITQVCSSLFKSLPLIHGL